MLLIRVCVDIDVGLCFGLIFSIGEDKQPVGPVPIRYHVDDQGCAGELFLLQEFADVDESTVS